MDIVHPLYRIVAVLCVGSVAKALFAPQRVLNPAVQNVAKAAGDVAAEKLSDLAGGK